MAIMMPETCETEVNNKDLIVASYWLSLSSHYVLPSSTKVTQLLKPEEHWFIVWELIDEYLISLSKVEYMYEA